MDNSGEKAATEGAAPPCTWASKASAASNDERPPFVTELTANDVLVGRGAPSIENEGNIRFRKLVQSRKNEYVSTGKRQRKDWIARQVIHAITLRKGRFLRKIESLVEAEQLGVPDGVKAWTCVDDDAVLQKVKQALRDRDIIDDQGSTEQKDDVPTKVSVTSPSRAFGNKRKSPSTPLATEERKQAGGTSASSQSETSNQISKLILSRQQTESSPGVAGSTTGSELPREHVRTVLDRFQGMRGFPELLETGLSVSNLSLLNATGSAYPRYGRPSPAQFAGPVSLIDTTPRVNPPSLQGKLPSRGTQGLALNASASGFLPARHTLNLERASMDQGPSAPQETSGDRAIRLAFDRAQSSPAEIDTLQCPFLQLSLIEMIMLSVLCSHGLPVWTPTQLEQTFLPARHDGSMKLCLFSWYDFANLLAKAAGDWYDSRRSIASTSLQLLDRSSGFHVEKKAVALAAGFQNDTKELAKKAVMLLEKVNCFAKREQVLPRHRDQDSVDLWLERELSRWADSLGVADRRGRPVPYSVENFKAAYSQYHQDDSLVTVAIFDRPSCREIYSQSSFLTRLRSIFLKNTEKDVAEKIQEVQLEPDAVSWKGRPSWWGSPGESLHHDMFLLDRLLIHGFLGVLEERGIGPVNRPDRPSLRDLGLRKAVVEERARILAAHLHRYETALSEKRILLDRAEQYITAVATPSSRGSSMTQHYAQQLHPPPAGTNLQTLRAEARAREIRENSSFLSGGESDSGGSNRAPKKQRTI